jgi:DNA-binding NarL/FixJ family response regulator
MFRSRDKSRPMALKILIADDHQAIRRGLCSVLEDAGWQVIAEAANGKEAVEKTEQLKPDLVILDITMPMMGGFEAAREILKSSPGVKILIFSMHESQQIKNEVSRLGAHGYVTKSAPLAQLIASVKSALSS